MPYAELNLEGRLVNEPEFRTGKDNQEYVTFRVAVNQQFGSQEYASFYSCTGKEDIANRVRKAGLHKPSDPYQRWLGVEGLSEQKRGNPDIC